MHKRCMLCIFLTVGIILVGVSGQSSNNTTEVIPTAEMNDAEFLRKFDEIGASLVCNYMGLSDPTQLKLNLSRPMTLQDVTKLTFLNKGNNLKAQELQFPEDISWRREVVDLIYSVFMASCPDIYINHDYTRIMRELILIYFNSVEPRTTQSDTHWSVVKGTLTSCKSSITSPFNFTSNGLLIDNLLKIEDHEEDPEVRSDDDTNKKMDADEDYEEEGEDDDDRYKYAYPILPQMDEAEIMFKLDPVIDVLWKTFSLTWATCLSEAHSKSPVLARSAFKRLFFKEFLAPLEERWKNPGIMKDFIGLILGDIDVPRMEHNSLYCIQAAYIIHDLEHYQLVRPIKKAMIDEGVAAYQNKRSKAFLNEFMF